MNHYKLTVLLRPVDRCRSLILLEGYLHIATDHVFLFQTHWLRAQKASTHPARLHRSMESALVFEAGREVLREAITRLSSCCCAATMADGHPHMLCSAHWPTPDSPFACELQKSKQKTLRYQAVISVTWILAGNVECYGTEYGHQGLTTPNSCRLPDESSNRGL